VAGDTLTWISDTYSQGGDQWNDCVREAVPGDPGEVCVAWRSTAGSGGGGGDLPAAGAVTLQAPDRRAGVFIAGSLFFPMG
jgi:hypothetical protein